MVEYRLDNAETVRDQPTYTGRCDNLSGKRTYAEMAERLMALVLKTSEAKVF